MEKLETIESTGREVGIETGPETPGRSAAPMPAGTTGAAESAVYTNKKLVTEALPDYYFIRREKTDPEKQDRSESEEEKYYELYQPGDFSGVIVNEYPVYTDGGMPAFPDSYDPGDVYQPAPAPASPSIGYTTDYFKP